MFNKDDWETWPKEFLCPICVEPTPLNQLGNEYSSHKLDDPTLTMTDQEFERAVTNSFSV